MICEGTPLIGSLPRSETPNRGFASKLPPPNPILNTQRQHGESQSSPRAIFKPLSSTSKNQLGEKKFRREGSIFNRGGGGVVNNQSQTSTSFCISGKSKNPNEQFEESEEQQQNNFLNIIESSIWTYYAQQKAQLVYKKYDNSQSNVIPSEGERYFASFFVDPVEVNNTVLGRSINQGDNIDNNISHKKPGELVFDSRFESGNLFAAFKISEREYDLVLQNDVNSKGNTQWFYFSVANTISNQLVKFNIVNLMKNDSLFSTGMKPVVLSTKTKALSGETWKRDGFSISYEKSAIKREGKKQNKYFYKLSFSYQFKHSRDTVLFAHCYPYTNSDLNRFITELYADPRRNVFLSQTVLCQALDKSNCYLHTISSSSSSSQSSQNGKTNSSKQIVFLTARQHPGETPASYLMQGAMEFLSDPENEEAAFLRDRFEFKIIPMMNPDGVIYGNYRCSLSGVDLNRQWSQPSKELHPTVYFAKKAILSLCRGASNCRLLCDFHGHSKKMNSFFYGNPNDEDPLIPKMIPLETSQLNKSIDFKNSSFHISADKSSTFRQALLTEMPYNRYIYTFEASFFGKQILRESNHFTIDDYLCLGRDVMRGLVVCARNEIQAGSFQNYELGLMKVIQKTEGNDCQMQKNDINQADMNNNQNEIDEGQQQLLDQQGDHTRIASDEGSDSSPSEDELSMNEKNSFANNQNPSKQGQFQSKNLQFRSSTSPNKTHRNSMTRSLINDETASTRKITKNCLKSSKLIQTDSDWNNNDHINNTNSNSSSNITDIPKVNPVESIYPMSPFRNPLINQALQNPGIDEISLRPSTNSLQQKHPFPARRHGSLQQSSTTNNNNNNQSYNFIKLKTSPKSTDNDWILGSSLNNNSDKHESSNSNSAIGIESDKIEGGQQKQQLIQQKQQQQFQQFRLSSYMGQKVPKEVVSSIQQELLLKTLNNNRLFVSGMKYAENILNNQGNQGQQQLSQQTNAITGNNTLSTAQSTLSQGIDGQNVKLSDAGTQTDITFTTHGRIAYMNNINSSANSKDNRDNNDNLNESADNNYNNYDDDSINNKIHTDPSGNIQNLEIIPFGVALNISGNENNQNACNDIHQQGLSYEQYDSNNNNNNNNHSSFNNTTRKVIRGGSSSGVNRKMISSFYPSQSYSPRSQHHNNNNYENNHKSSPLSHNNTNITGSSFYNNKNTSIPTTTMVQGTAINNNNNINNFKTASSPSSSNFLHQQQLQQSPQQQAPLTTPSLQPYQYNKNHLSYISPKKKKQYVIQIRKKDSMLTTTHTISSNSPNAQLLLMKTPIRDNSNNHNIMNSNNANNLVIHSPLLNIFKQTITSSYQSSAGVNDPYLQSQSCRNNSYYNANNDFKGLEINNTINSFHNNGKGSVSDVYAASPQQQYNSRSYSLTSTPSTQGSRRSSSNAPTYQLGGNQQQKQFKQQQQQQLQLNDPSNPCISDMIKTRKLVAFSSPFKIKNINNNVASQSQLNQGYEQ